MNTLRSEPLEDASGASTPRSSGPPSPILLSESQTLAVSRLRFHTSGSGSGSGPGSRTGSRTGSLRRATGSYLAESLKGLEHFRDKNEIGPKLAIIMVGLPARGKSFIVKKLKRYLAWLGFRTKIFNVGDRRRVNAEGVVSPDAEHVKHSSAFFDPSNQHATDIRSHIALETLEEMLAWLRDGGKVAIHDATNSTVERRAILRARCEQEPNLQVLFLESICTDPTLLARNIHLKVFSPDYANIPPAEAKADFLARLAHYERSYVSINEAEEAQGMAYAKIIDVGRKCITHHIQGFLPGQVLFYLMNMNLAHRQLWFTRHGESEDNVTGRIGGDAPLSPRGHRYAAALVRFIDQQDTLFRARMALRERVHVEDGFNVLTSNLHRTIQTVAGFDPAQCDIKHFKFLNELGSGICDGLTYEEIEERFPAEYKERAHHKLSYRYPGPGGESYLDVVERINPVLVEIERLSASTLIVSHRVVMRSLLAYMLDISGEEMVRMDCPLHWVTCVEVEEHGVSVVRWRWDENLDEFIRVGGGEDESPPPYHLRTPLV